MDVLFALCNVFYYDYYLVFVQKVLLLSLFRTCVRYFIDKNYWDLRDIYIL